jgi:uncharacterized membrane protein YdjX (TVP38/TMEM64 family)
MSLRSYRSVGQLSARGAAGVALLRLTGVTSAGSVHLACGAARTPFPTYMVGTAAGLTPAVVALSALGGLLRRALLNPSMTNGMATIGAAVLLFALASALRGVLLVRQFASATSSHRGRAEFG